MKKLLTFLLAGMLIFSANAFAADNVEVYLNGEKQDVIVSVSQIDGTVLVPIRPIFELFNYKLEWDNMRKRITTSTVLGKMVIGIGSLLVSQNDYQAYVLSTYPRLWNGSTMIPIEFASDCTDSSIQYVESGNSLIINAN